MSTPAHRLQEGALSARTTPKAPPAMTKIVPITVAKPAAKKKT